MDNSEAAIVRDYSLNTKQQNLKNKFYNKNKGSKQQNSQGSINEAPTNQKRVSFNQNQQKQQSYYQNVNNQNSNNNFQNNNGNQQDTGNFKRIYNQISDEQVDDFLKNMEKEFETLSKQQVTVGMLNTQQRLISNHNDILNDNQKHIAQMLKQQQLNGNNSQFQNQNQDILKNKQLLKELMDPVNQQIQEIKKMYEESKQAQTQLQNQLQSQNNTQNLQQQFSQYLNNSTNLKDKIGNTTQDLKGLLPNNIGVLENMQNFNLDVYTTTINNLKNQIAELQNDCEKAEEDLKYKYDKIASAPKEEDILEPYIKKIEKSVSGIDMQTKRRNLLKKLGGEFNYDQFDSEVQDIVGDFYQVVKDYNFEAQAFEIQVPKYHINSQDLKDFNYKGPSILDEMKERLGIDFTSYEKLLIQKKKQKEQQQKQVYDQLQQEESNKIKRDQKWEQQADKQNSNMQSFANQIPNNNQYNQGNSQKPKNLQGLVTKPQEPDRDIKFSKQTNIKTGADDFKSVFATDYEEEKRQEIQNRQNQQRLNKAEQKGQEKDLDDKTYVNVGLDEMIAENLRKKTRTSIKEPEKKPVQEKKKNQEEGVVEITYTKDGNININPDQSFLERQKEIEDQKIKILEQENNKEQNQQLNKDQIRELMMQVLQEHQQMQQNQQQQQQNDYPQMGGNRNLQHSIASFDYQDSPRNNKQKVGFSDQNKKQSQFQKEQDKNQSPMYSKQGSVSQVGQKRQSEVISGFGAQGSDQAATGMLGLFENIMGHISEAVLANNQNNQQQQQPQNENMNERQDFIRAQAPLMGNTYNQNSMNQQMPVMPPIPQQSQYQPFQPPTQMPSQFMYPQPISTPIMPVNMFGGQQNNNQKNKKPQDLDQYYKEYQLSEDESVSRIDKSVSGLLDNSQMVSNDKSMYQSQYTDISKSEGQISIPDYYNKKNDLSDGSIYNRVDDDKSVEDSYSGNSNMQLSEGEVQI